jgi:hypothetical protein
LAGIGYPRFNDGGINLETKVASLIWLWLSPILLFIVLMASGRASALQSAVSAVLASLAVAGLAAPQMPGVFELGYFFAAGLWLVLPTVFVIMAGQFFAESIRPIVTTSLASEASHRQIADTCLASEGGLAEIEQEILAIQHRLAYHHGHG